MIEPQERHTLGYSDHHQPEGTGNPADLGGNW
jgi:hypothetical protein